MFLSIARIFDHLYCGQYRHIACLRITYSLFNLPQYSKALYAKQCELLGVSRGSCAALVDMLGMSTMKTKNVLYIFLAIMAGLIAFAAFFTAEFIALLKQPALRDHALFFHIISATLFFANAAIGMVWEKRSLVSGRKEVILHTYKTVTWIDARFSSPLVIFSLLSGLMLAFLLGDLWEIGWLSTAFILFMFSGLFWIASDIPTQYKVKRLMAGLKDDDQALPEELARLLKLRWWISLGGVAPLMVVFTLMVYKPDMPAVGMWFR